jgi:hypothetical protein
MKINLKKSFVIGMLVVVGILYSDNVFAVTENTYDMTDSTLKTYTANDVASGNANISTSCKTGAKKDFTEVFTYLLCILDSGIIPLLISIGLIIFLAGVVKFVSAGDNEEKRQGGRQMMIFGIIALFVMVGVWGFVNILSNTFFGKNSELQTLPKKGSSIYLTQ